MLGRMLIALTFTWTCMAATDPQKFDLVRGYVLVHATVQGHGPYLFLLDTGAESSTVTPKVARDAGLSSGYAVIVSTAAGDRHAPVTAARVEVAGSRADNVELVVMPLEQMRTLAPNIQGVLGQSFLSRFPCLIDYRSHRLWLGGEAVFRAERVPTAIPVRRAGGRVVVPVMLDNQPIPYRLVLDSGANRLVLNCARRCPRLPAAETSSHLLTNAGSAEQTQGILGAIRVASIKIPRPAAAIVATPALTTEEDGVLPAHYFSAVYVNPKTNELRLAR